MVCDCFSICSAMKYTLIKFVLDATAQDCNQVTNPKICICVTLKRKKEEIIAHCPTVCDSCQSTIPHILSADVCCIN